LVDGGIDEILPPTSEEIKTWKTLYLTYFNSEKSLADGRRLPLSKCVKNPRPDEISEALRQLGYRSICHHVSLVLTC
jgi:signal recognition particle subunit SEC65